MNPWQISLNSWWSPEDIPGLLGDTYSSDVNSYLLGHFSYSYCPCTSPISLRKNSQCLFWKLGPPNDSGSFLALAREIRTYRTPLSVHSHPYLASLRQPVGLTVSGSKVQYMGHSEITVGLSTRKLQCGESDEHSLCLPGLHRHCQRNTRGSEFDFSGMETLTTTAPLPWTERWRGATGPGSSL